MSTPTGDTLEAMVQRHEYTLYGVDRRNGLMGTATDHEKRIQSLEKRLIIISATSAGGGAAVAQLLARLFGA